MTEQNSKRISLRSSIEKNTANETNATLNMTTSRKLSPPGKNGIESITAIGNNQQSTISNFYCHGYHNEQKYYIDKFDRENQVIFGNVVPPRGVKRNSITADEEMQKTEPINLSNNLPSTDKVADAEPKVENTRYQETTKESLDSENEGE